MALLSGAVFLTFGPFLGKVRTFGVASLLAAWPVRYGPGS